ncbi:hypothetical protein BGW80DRAFT_1259330 [Lactifluus volemus]|nr:hypothetical protein BGW80DRAFT_1259330 [Lactifluus volemus]
MERQAKKRNSEFFGPKINGKLAMPPHGLDEIWPSRRSETLYPASDLMILPQCHLVMGIEPLVQIEAVCITLVRLWIRRGRYWWDDAWAFFSLLWLIIQMVAVFVHAFSPSKLSKVSRVADYYLLSATFYGVIWCARLSILFSIIRIDPNPVMRQRLKWVAAVFIAAVAFLLAQLFWVCQTNENGWKDSAHPQCNLPKQVPICQLVFVTTVVSLVHSFFILTSGGVHEAISALVENCMSLTVANVPVVATALFRPFWGYQTEDDDDGKRWTGSALRFHSRPGPRVTTTTTGTQWSIGFISRFGRGDASDSNATELTDTTLDSTKQAKPVYTIGTLDPEEMFVTGKTTEQDDKNAATNEGGGVVHIDVLPYPGQPPSSKPESRPSSDQKKKATPGCFLLL